MSVVPVSQVELVRERKGFERVISQRSWHQVLDQEKRLIAAVNEASEDSAKDMASLLSEMRTVVALYRDLIDQCAVRVERAVSSESSMR